MSYSLPPKLKPKVAAKWAEAIAPLLAHDEAIWAFVRITRLKPMTEGVAVTNRRLLGFWGHGPESKRLPFQASVRDIVRIDFPEKLGQHKLVVTTPSGEINFGDVRKDEFDFAQYYVNYLIEASGTDTQRNAQKALPAVGAPLTTTFDPREQQTGRETSPVYGVALDDFWSQPIQTYSAAGELPWFVVNNAPVGLLAAFEDRLLVVSLVQGRYGSSVETSAATFAYSDIAKIEYPRGFVDGVLEVRTVSDLGSARASGSLRIPRSVYEQVAPKIEAIRAVVAGLQPKPIPVISPPPLRLHGAPIDERDKKLILDHSGSDEEPWLILHNGGSGVLAAFDDRLFMSTQGVSRPPGTRVNTTFPYVSIKKIEYTQGQSDDVLQVVIWGPQSDDPAGQLTLPKRLRDKTLQNLRKLRRKASGIDGPPVSMWKPPMPPRVVETPVESGLASELKKLAGLFNQGLIDAEEFKEAKRAVIAAHTG